jgi:hypothetical protein
MNNFCKFALLVMLLPVAAFAQIQIGNGGSVQVGACNVVVRTAVHEQEQECKN